MVTAITLYNTNDVTFLLAGILVQLFGTSASALLNFNLEYLSFLFVMTGVGLLCPCNTVHIRLCFSNDMLTVPIYRSAILHVVLRIMHIC